MIHTRQRILISFLLLFGMGGNTWARENLLLVGKVPGEYLGLSKEIAYKACLGIEKGVIRYLAPFKNCELEKIEEKLQIKAVELKTGNKYDVIYPGLIDLHNHTKQNVLSVWDKAQGQFDNRFEWRSWGEYKKAVSGNMNPWISLGSEMNCAAFRWSELQAMVLGTTYLQGPSWCVDDFSIHKVEDRDSFISKKAAVQAPTDLIIPGDMVFLWNTIRPKMKAHQLNYAEALKAVIHEYCPKLKSSIKDVLGEQELDILGDQDKLKAGCEIQSDDDEERFPPKFVRYIYWVHKTVAGKIKYLEKEGHSAFITHLAEGRRDDPYNKLEFKMLHLLGLTKPHVNLVHALGLSSSDYRVMAKNRMGLIWSPFSNLLLYAQTANIALAKSQGVLIALGSDWTPTGSRGVLEELKLVSRYVQKDPEKKGLRELFGDEELYKMVTENPARMINHWDISEEEAGVGRLAIGAMGSVIVAREQARNPYTNLVRKTYAQDLNLVVVDGKALYGNEALIKKIHPDKSYEVLSDSHFSAEEIKKVKLPLLADRPNTEEKTKHLIHMAKKAQDIKPTPNQHCNFSHKKVFVHQQSQEDRLQKFSQATGLNLDRYQDIARLLGLGLLTQARNLHPESNDKEYAAQYFPPLYSCEDPAYLTGQGEEQKNGLLTFIQLDTDGDDYTKNRENRAQNREKHGLDDYSKRLFENYHLR